jgi:formate dehydrogenase iron-sulfur subunit
MALQSLDIARRSATTTEAPQARDTTEVAKLIDVSACIGCKACQAACMEWNDIRPELGSNVGIYDNPQDLDDKTWTLMRFTEVEESGRLEWLIRKDGCMHCADPGCLKACPAPGAIIQYKACPTGAIKFGAKEDMVHYAETRIADLKERGYQNAGLYDPQGVGGTHVMYVLHHADRPSLYAGLPDDPQISPMVSLWKGIAKPLAMVALGATALGGLFHYVMKGPNEVSKELEDEMEKEDAK